MYNNKNLLIIPIVLITVIILLWFLIKGKKNLKESFNICQSCNFPSNPDVFMRRNMRTCNVSGCDRDSRNIPYKRSRKWNRGKSSVIKNYCRNYINKLHDFDFSKFSNQESYNDDLRKYRGSLRKNYKRSK